MTAQEKTLSVLAPEAFEGIPTPLQQEEGLSSPSQQMTEEEHEALFEKLQSQAKAARKRYRQIRGGYVGGLSLICIAMTLLAFHPTSAPGLIPVALVTMLAAAGVFLFTGRNWRKTANAMAPLKDIRAVGPLVDALWAPGEQDIQTTRDALIVLLPKLQASDAHLLDDSQRKILLRFLKGIPLVNLSQYDDLVIAILKAFEQVGDDRELAVVERVAGGEGTGRNPRIQDAAQMCLPYLQARAGELQISQHLLRAADGNVTPIDTLLRPAAGAPITEPEQLLRPAITSNDKN